MKILGFSSILIITTSLTVRSISSLDVRLIGGSDTYRGRVEVRHDGVWGTVCDDGWDIPDATVICRMLGFENGAEASGYANYGEGSGSIFLDNVNCSGLESDIGDCDHNGFEVHNCQHAEDAGVLCFKEDLQVRLVGGHTALEGRVEVFFSGSWGTVCDDGWDLRDATVVCRMLGFRASSSASTNAEYGAGSGSIVLDDVQCLGTERNLNHCSHNGYEKHNCQHSEDAGVVCSDYAEESNPLQVRLVDGPSPREGRVEVLYNGSWGTICDDYWYVNDARVVCRMLGFDGALSSPGSASYGKGSGRIILDDVICDGSERNLAECTHRDFGVHNCGHAEDAGAVCFNHANEDMIVEVRLADGRYKNEGRVEMFFNRTWGTVCSNGWDLREADVVCRMLGFTEASDVLRNAAFGEGFGTVFLEGINCLGSENNLINCPFTAFVANSCPTPHSPYVGVMCKDRGSLTIFGPATSLSDTDNVSPGTTYFNNCSVSSLDSRRNFLPVSLALGTILALSYAVFLLVGLYVCYRRRDPERIGSKEQTGKLSSKGTCSSEASSAYLNLTAPSENTKDSPGKDDPAELQYMGLDVTGNTTSGDRVYTDLSFEKGSAQGDTSRKFKPPMKPPIGHKPKSGKLGLKVSPDRVHTSSVTSHDPIYANCYDY